MIPYEYTYQQNTFCGALSVKPRSMDYSVHDPKELKKVRDVATSPLPHHIRLKWRVSILASGVVCWT